MPAARRTQLLMKPAEFRKLQARGTPAADVS